MNKLYIACQTNDNIEDFVIFDVEAVVIYQNHIQVYKENRDVTSIHIHDYKNITITPQ